MEKIEKTSKKNQDLQKLSPVLIKLLQGFVYMEEKQYWESLLVYQDAVRAYFKPLGLYLHLSQDDGYAFLKSLPTTCDFDAQDDLSFEQIQGKQDIGLSLVRKIPLSFEVTLLCILLREALEQFDSTLSDDHRLILHRNDIFELLKVFYPERNNELPLIKRFNALIKKVQDLGFLKPLKSSGSKDDLFEVKRPIKALIDAQKLSEIKKQMLLVSKDFLGANSDTSEV